MTTIKVLGKEYRIKAGSDPEHLQTVAEFVDQTLREVQRSTPDTQDAAILVALNIASDLLRLRGGVSTVEPARIQALIDLVDSA